MGEAARKHFTVDEFLAWEGEENTRYELFSGEIVAMAPPSNAHAQIAANATIQIGQRLKPPCRILNELGIRLPGREDSYYQADAAIVCSSYDPQGRGVRDPVVIIEVLSPSTTIKDSGIKLSDYRRIWSVKEVVLIHGHRQRVEVFRRTQEAWTVIDLEATDRVVLESVGIDFPVETLYEGFQFPQGDTAESS
jgi:Uma2 family endonuclease